MCSRYRPSKKTNKQKKTITLSSCVVACVVIQSDHLMSVKPHKRKVFLSGPTYVAYFQ